MFDYYGRASAEFQVNSETESFQATPLVASLADGGFVVTWTTGDPAQDGWGSAVKAQIYDGSGAPVGSEFLVNSQSSQYQFVTSIAPLVGGGFVVAWLSNDTSQDGSGTAIKAQVFDSAGGLVGAEFLINTAATSYQGDAKVAGLAGGGFVISWTTGDPAQDGSGTAIKAQVYGADGLPSGTELLVNSEGAGDQNYSTLTGLPGGGFIVSWASSDPAHAGNESDVKARIFGSDGLAVGDEFLVSGDVDNFEGRPTVATLPGTGFVIIWTQHGQNDFRSTIEGRVFDVNGAPVGADFQISADAGFNAPAPQVTSMANGGFAITWQNDDPDLDATGAQIMGRIFSPDGQPQGNEFVVNSFTEGGQGQPAIASLDDDRLVLAWTSMSPTQEIKAQILQVVPPAAPTDISLSSSSVGENAAVDTVVGKIVVTDTNLNDVFAIHILSDDTAGGFKVENGKIVVADSAKIDFDTFPHPQLTIEVTDADGLTYQETLTIDIVDLAESRTYVGTSAANSFAATADDHWTVSGLAGHDTLTTLGGNDLVAGGSGDDTISTGGGDDAITFTGPGEGYDAVDGGAGVDWIKAGSDNSVIGLRSLAQVEYISAEGFDNVSIKGSNVSDTLNLSAVEVYGITRIDGGGGNDTITGSQYDDTIIGGAGTDVLDGQAGTDTFFLSGATEYDSIDGGADYDLIFATKDNTSLLWSRISNVEFVSAGGFANMRILGRNGADTLDFSGLYLDGVTIDGGNGVDTIIGSLGYDTIVGGAGNDILSGGELSDVFLLSSTSGNDTIDGGADYDFIRATSADTKIVWGFTGIEAISGGGFANVKIVGTNAADIMDFTSYTLTGIAAIDGGKGNDTITGTGNADTIVGNAGDDTLSGAGGNDIFQFGGASGSDTIDGGAGHDVIAATAAKSTLNWGNYSNVEAISAGGYAGVKILGTAGNDLFDFSGIDLDGIAVILGGGGADAITGSASADVFGYASIADSRNASGVDTIHSFQDGVDRIDLSAIDANSKIAANQEFTFLGTGNFTGVAGQVRIDSSVAGTTRILADIDGNKGADLVIILSGNHALTSADFML